MAAKKAAPKRAGKGSAGENMIISKSRTKAAVKKCNVASDFYCALDGYVRKAIECAEQRAMANGRKTIRPQDL